MQKNKIFEFRTQKGFTQRQMAEKLSVPYQLLQKWEQGKSIPSVINAIAVARVLDTTVEELFPLED